MNDRYTRQILSNTREALDREHALREARLRAKMASYGLPERKA